MDKIIKYGDQKTEITGQDFGIFHVVRKSENFFEKEIDDIIYRIPLWICVDESGKEYELDSAYLRTNPKTIEENKFIALSYINDYINGNIVYNEIKKEIGRTK